MNAEHRLKVIARILGCPPDEIEETLLALVEPEQPPEHLPDVHIWVDGGCLSNGMDGAYAYYSVVALSGDDEIHSVRRREIPSGLPQTNNAAEYVAVRHALRWAAENTSGVKVFIHTDSQLIVGQLLGGWKVKSAHLRKLWADCAALLAEGNATLIKEPRSAIEAVLGH